MAVLTVRDLDEELIKRLEAQAQASGRSLEEEVRRLIEEGAAFEEPAGAALQRPPCPPIRFPKVKAVEASGRPASEVLLEDRDR